MPADVAAIVHPSQKETLRVRELRQLAWQSDRAGVVDTCWDLVAQALMRALVIEHVAKVIETAGLFRNQETHAFLDCDQVIHFLNTGDLHDPKLLYLAAWARASGQSQGLNPPVIVRANQ